MVQKKYEFEYEKRVIPGSDGKFLRSSFPGIWKPSSERGLTLDQNPFDWIAAKRRDDDVGTNWRVHDKIYNLQNFIDKHPGGKDWIKITRGTDITEAFEASHVVNVEKVEAVLAKYYVEEAKHPRNSPYTFKEDGFYKILKKRVEPILQRVGTGSSPISLYTQDALAVIFISLSLLGVWLNSISLQILGGFVLGMCAVAAHNFIHMKDAWRRFYFDLSSFSSHEWRISHALSHHLYPNTILDYEISMLEPFMEFLPMRPRSWICSSTAIIFLSSQIVYLFGCLAELVKRIGLVIIGKQNPRPENCIVFIELLVFEYVAPSVFDAVIFWLITHMACSYYITLVGLNAAHHHPSSFHDGDEPRLDPDFGLCQLDATKEKSDEYHKTSFAIMVTFGEHPLHHLFPTVCHSKLHHVKPIFEETLREFKEYFPPMSQLELYLGTYKQCVRTERNPISPGKKTNTSRIVSRGEK